MTDADLFTCLDTVQQLYFACDGDTATPADPAETGEVMRLFESLGDRDLRTAVLDLMRALAWPVPDAASCAASVPTHPAANTTT